MVEEWLLTSLNDLANIETSLTQKLQIFLAEIIQISEYMDL